jgi:hypothetical protein
VYFLKNEGEKARERRRRRKALASPFLRVLKQNLDV